MITGPRQAITNALIGIGLHISPDADPSVDTPTVFVQLTSAEPDPTACAHDTELVVMLISSLDDPAAAAGQLETVADNILEALKPVATFVSLTAGTLKDRAPSFLLTFATRQ